MKKLWLTIIATSAFICGYGAVADAFPSAGIYGRGEWRGYFTNTLDTAGTDVWPRNYQSGTEAMPSSINSATEFINFVMGKYNSGTTQERTGAAFIMSTMLELNGNSDRTPDTARWAEVVRTAVNHGHVTWRANFSYTINSYYQGNPPNDDAFYDNSGTFPAMIFEDEYGRVTYVLKWQCANPVGTPTTFNTYSLEQPWDISASTYVVNGAGDDSRSSAGTVNTYVGDTLTWTHRVLNTGSFTNPTQIASWSQQNLDGGPLVTITPRFTIGVMAGGASHTYSDPVYIVPNLPVGTNICRTAWYNPARSSSNADERSPGHCARVQASWELEPTISVRVNGAATNLAEAGDTVTFTYAVTNSGGDGNNIGCTIYGLTRSGYYTVPGTPDSTSDAGFVQPAHGCPRAFPGGNTTTTLVTETVPAASVAANNSVCRSLFVNPSSPGGPSLGYEACAYVVQKPYSRVYSGDVVTGFNFEYAPGTCTTYADAAIIGWNRRGGGAWAGAGVQHAARATGQIFDFATSLGGIASIAPQGLAFANTTTDTANGEFGGLFDWAPCAPNFYANRPASATAIPASLSTLTDGVYAGTGNFTLTGDLTVPAGSDITVYVDGSVMINGNIRYASGWAIGQIPVFRLIVEGSIYVDNDVSQLDGLFVAQQDAAASGGLIVSCATGMSTPTLNGTLLTTCDQKLTVNGAFVSRHLRLLRTIGTLRQSAAGEASTSGNIAEVFNYTPSVWIPRPDSSTSAPEYDAITSLPPIL